MTLKYNILNTLILFILVVGLCSGCKTDKTDLDIFLSQMDNAFSDNERTKLIECPDIECIESFILSNPHNNESKQLFRKIPKNLIDSIDSLGVGNYQILFLMICYNYRENNKLISFKEILESIKKYDKNKEQISEQNTLDKINKLTEIAEDNFKRINLGDTICLYFPLKYTKGVYEVLYRIPFEKEKLCTLTCNILKKEFLPKNNQYKFDNDQFILTMKVVELNPKPLHFGLKDIKQEDKFVLDIFDYGQGIRSY